MNSEVHSVECVSSYQLCLHISVSVDEEGWEVLVGVVLDAIRGDGAYELGVWEPYSELPEVLVDKVTQRDGTLC